MYVNYTVNFAGPECFTSDTTKPTVSLTSPAGGATVGGKSVALKAEASDDTGVAEVRFYVYKNSAWSQVGTDTTAGGTSGKEYSYDWDSTTVPDGTNYFKADARDAAGNVASTASSSFTVKNAAPPPIPRSPRLGFDPAPGQTGVARNTSVAVEFSEAMDSASINTATFKLQRYDKKRGRWLAVSGSAVSCDDSCVTATLDPYGSSPTTVLSANTKHRVTVSGAYDMAGNPVLSGAKTIFTTGRS